MDENNKKEPEKNGYNKRMFVICLVGALLAVMIFSYLSRQINAAKTEEITYNRFLDMIKAGDIESVEIQSDRIVITPKKKTTYSGVIYYTGVVADDDLKNMLYEAGIPFNAQVVDRSTTIFDILLVYILPFVLIYGLMYFLFRSISKNSGGIMGVGRSNAKVYVEKETGVTFKDVAGQEEAKDSIRELVDFLHNPGKYQKIGAKLPKGALLVGPPGTGKTLLAKAVAGEAHVPFFSLAGSDFVEMFVGVGASRVRDLFKQAQAQAPCIIFIDEIDAIGKSRDNQLGGNDEREQTLNQLLAEMDGFDTSKGIVILAATNRPDVLDKALLRPGRFDRRIIVDKPDLKGRIEVLKVHAKNVFMDESVNLEEIGLATSGAVGSDLANIINEAAILAVKQGRTAVTQADLMESVEVVIAGKEKKDRVLSAEEKRVVAYHETGHALITALEKKAEPVQKITIVPRTMGSLGYVMQVPEEEKYLETEEGLKAQLVTLYGGRAAEELVFGSITTGASNDIEKATAIARAMITQYGMSKRFGAIGLESIQNRYLDGRPVMHCGEETAGKIDEEVMALLSECYNRAKELLSGNKDILDKIATFLSEKETITGKQFMELYNEAIAERGQGAGGEAGGDAAGETDGEVADEAAGKANQGDSAEVVDGADGKDISEAVAGKVTEERSVKTGDEVSEEAS
ncbi:MAG: ATP-dependent zinc metalloprotease FtsH [Lachnospiraceae bacterium]|nr:ATP-dependent zinc metalloprotease FtsH [Lachnospiraceae bacterium]